MKLTFYKGTTAPNAEAGGIWFDVSTKTIKVKTDAGWDVFGGNQEVLTQAEYDALETKDNTKIYFIKDA